MEVSSVCKPKNLEEETARLKKVLAEFMLDASTLREMLEKLLTPGSRRKSVSWAIGEKDYAQRREVERRREALQAEVAAAGVSEPVPVPHPNLPAPYRRKAEALEEALRDEATALLAAEAEQRPNVKSPALCVQNGRSGVGQEVLETLDPGTRIGFCRTVLQR